MKSVVGLALALWMSTTISTASASLITNGDFETGDFTGWTTYQTTNGTVGHGLSSVVPFDTIGNSLNSNAARFNVGQAVFEGFNVYRGGGIFQNIVTASGDLSISANVAVLADAVRNNNGAGRFELLLDNSVVASREIGFIASGTIRRDALSFSGPVNAGSHEIRLQITRGSQMGASLNPDGTLSLTPFQFIDDIIGSFTSTHPMNYGLFIGVHDKGKHNDLRADLAAEMLATSFSALPNSKGIAITGNRLQGSGVSVETVRQEIEKISSYIRSGDTLTLYISGHGGLTIPILGSPGDEFVVLGQGASGMLTDDSLTGILASMPGVNKFVIIDSCSSGGFWGSGDFTEAFDAGDLETISHTALLASASEGGTAHFSGDGFTFMSRALVNAWTEQSGGHFISDTNSDGLLSPQEIHAAVLSYPTRSGTPAEDEIVFEMDFGDAVPYSPSIWTPVVWSTADFSGGISVGVTNVPEPQTPLLVFLAVLSAAFNLTLRSRNRVQIAKGEPR